MAKPDLDLLIDEAQVWLYAVTQIQSIAESGEWDELAAWQKKREDSVCRYQAIAGPFDFGQHSALSLQPLDQLLQTIKQLEDALIARFQDYQYQLVESLKSVQMEGTLQKRYGLEEE